MADIFAGSLSDPRVQLVVQDVRTVIRVGNMRYDAILPDVDNGPDGLTVESNDALYGKAGLASVHAALRTGGVLTVWSAGPDSQFRKRLMNAGFQVEEVQVRANKKRGARHVIWVASKSD